MKKTSIYLDPDVDLALARLAEAQRLTKAELVRRILARAVAEEPRPHHECVAWYERVREEIATTPLVLAEVDHLAATRAGGAALGALRADVAAGAYAVEWWPEAVIESVELAERYADLELSLADASLVALAARLETTKSPRSTSATSGR